MRRPAYVRAYVKRNKTDAADAAALIEASRADDLLPVRVKSIEQQALQALHRSRSAWMATRTARINTLRGFCREFGIAEVTHFKDARHFASWFGLTPKESSSGMTRRLGRISKRGDRYLRMLLTHGARSVLRAATVADRQGRSVDALRRWALGVQARTHHNRATCALANKMARICYAVLRDHADYGAVRIDRKMRATYALPN
jgi:transposase